MNIPVVPRSAPVEVTVTRGGIVESRHAVRVAVADASGRLRAVAGDPSKPIILRSAAKPFQALPLVEDGVADRLGMTEAELALCCASHGGQPEHVRVAKAILDRVGLDESDLACGPHAPLFAPEARRLADAGGEPGRLHNNCSGKHAGMLALAAVHGWPVEGYHRPDHPVQDRMRAEVARWCETASDRIAMGVDGCGVVCFAVPLADMAAAFARFTVAADRGEAPARLVGAMVGQPFMVGGTGRLCTELMQRAGVRVFAKTGAEGVYGAGLRGVGLGVALKALDGGARAAETALLRVLAELGVLDATDLEALGRRVRPEVRNTRGELTGHVEARFGLEHDLDAPEDPR